MKHHDAEGKIVALLGAKFHADLTPNQPNSYWQGLPADTPSALVFMVPSHRLYDLRGRLTERKDNPSSEVVGYKAVKILRLAERVGVRETR